jgi:glycosyltransferase involved in cell wall biosynthesis
MRDLIVLIPSYNEKLSLKKIILKIQNKIDIIVINDGSTDNTKYFLRQKNIISINQKTNKGYEASLLNGIKYAIKNSNKKKYLLTFDADGQHKLRDINRIYDFIKKKNADMVIGNRDKKNRFLERIISLVFYYKHSIHDPLSGLKIYNIKSLKSNFKEISINFFLVDLVIKFVKKNLLIYNFSININNRKGSSRVGNFLKTNIKMLKILTIIFFNQNKYFIK